MLHEQNNLIHHKKTKTEYQKRNKKMKKYSNKWTIQI